VSVIHFNKIYRQIGGVPWKFEKIEFLKKSYFHKSTILSYIFILAKNGQKMTKNAQKRLKTVQLTPNFDKRCILGCFINSQIFENFRPFLADFLQK